MAIKKIIIFTFLVLTACASFCSAAPAGTATPCPPASLFLEEPFVIYCEKQGDISEITDVILKDFPKV